jgi:hypothetical protein
VPPYIAQARAMKNVTTTHKRRYIVSGLLQQTKIGTDTACISIGFVYQMINIDRN